MTTDLFQGLSDSEFKHPDRGKTPICKKMNIERPTHHRRAVSIEYWMGKDEETEIVIQGLASDI